MFARLSPKRWQASILAPDQGIDFAGIKWQALFNLFLKVYAGIAQLVEQRIRNAKVVGSIPISGTKLPLK